jgi:CheY-like chemotaxis protein
MELRPGNYILICMTDTGVGMTPEVVERAFDPFFTTKPIGQGTGLGLSVTLGIVQQLGGRISVENRAASEGSGARFTVHLPTEGAGVEAGDSPVRIATSPAAPQTPPTAPLAVSAESIEAPKPRVLIIDDEPSIRAALRRFFARRGWQGDEAEDGAEGVSVMLSGKSDFAVVISDLKMPGCSGVELHDHVAAVAPELLERIVFSTGDVASKDAAEFVQRTRCTVMQKPFELRALEGVVNRVRQATTSSAA